MWADRDPRAELKILNFTSPKGPNGTTPIGIGQWRDICDAACLTIFFFFILIDYYLFIYELVSIKLIVNVEEAMACSLYSNSFMDIIVKQINV